MKTFSPNAVISLSEVLEYDGGGIRWARFDDGSSCGFITGGHSDSMILEVDGVELNQDLYVLKAFYLRTALAEWHKSLGGVVQANIKGLKDRINGLFKLAGDGDSKECHEVCYEDTHKMRDKLIAGCAAVRSAGDNLTALEKGNLHQELLEIIFGDCIDCGFSESSPEFMILRELQLDMLEALPLMSPVYTPDSEEGDQG